MTSGGGHRPVWTPDGTELYYDLDSRLYVVPITTEGRFAAGPRASLPIMGFIQGFGRRTYDLTPDGKQFLMLFR